MSNDKGVFPTKLTEGGLQKYLKPRSFLETASLANLIVLKLSGGKLEQLKEDLKAKAEYLQKTAILSDSKAACEALAEQCGDLLCSISFYQCRHSDKSDRRDKFDLKGISSESELSDAIDKAKKLLNTRVISPRLIRSSKDKMRGNSRMIARFGHDLYYSGPKIGKAAAQALGGSITLDPASSPEANRWIGAEKIFTEKEDGLKQSWHGERLFINPPYMPKDGVQQIPLFVNKAIEACDKGGSRAVILLNNNTDTKTWGQPLLRAANAICFPAGRLKFWNAEGQNETAAIQGQMIVSLKCHPEDFEAAFKPFGVTGRWT